jgi:uncharacterized repeat protein (TIGR03803 family)
MRRAAESGTIHCLHRPARLPGYLENLSNMPSHRSLAAVAARRIRLLSLAALVLAPIVAHAQATPAVSTVVAFSGSVPIGNLVKGADGALYGVTSTSTSVTTGLVYRATVDGTSVVTLHQIKPEEALNPQAGLVLASDNKLYGTTKLGMSGTLDTTGTIFTIAQSGTGYTTLYRFASFTTVNQNSQPINTDGAYPQTELIEGTDGNLYGVATAGGANGTGTVFRMSRDGTAFQTLHVFGAITSTVASGLTVNADGATSSAPLVQGADGLFYGTSALGGANGRGVVFRLAFDGTGFQVLHVFPEATADATTGLLKNSEGAVPLAGLVDGHDGFFYGVASQGGATGHGTLFAISPDGAAFTVIHEFDGNNGSGPVSELLVGRDGRLYGATSAGGTSSSGAATAFGTLFVIARDGTGFTRLHSLDGTNGSRPSSQLLQLSDTVFVGVATASGTCGSGTIFRYSTTGDTVTGNTKCGVKKQSAYGSGATGPAVLLLMGGLGLARRRRR